MSIQELGFAATVAAAVLGLVLALGKAALSQFERRQAERFEALQKSIHEDSKDLRALKSEFETHLKSLPLEYVRREDWIRFSSVIDTKLDRLNERMSELARAEFARIAKGGG